MLRRLLLVALCGTILTLLGVRLHRRALPQLEAAGTPHTLGVLHVHSAASHDGTATLEQLAAHANRLGLHFVLVTDHNKQLGGSVVLDGVTILNAAEVSTPYGHLIQLGATALPDDAARQEVAIVQAIRDAGGFPILAHPADPKRPWTGAVGPAGGFEIANYAASARRRGGPLLVGLLPALLAYRLNPPLALAQALDRNTTALRRWDEERNPAVVGFCGTDAHGRYLDIAHELRSWNVALLDPLEPDAPGFAEAVLNSLRRGRFHCFAPLFGRDPELVFEAVRDDEPLGWAGDTVFEDAIDHLVVRGPRSSIATPTLVLLRDGLEMARTQAGVLRYRVLVPGSYRAEVRLPVPDVFAGERLLPVAYTNRIRVAATDEELPPPELHRANVALVEPPPPLPEPSEPQPAPQPTPTPAEKKPAKKPKPSAPSVKKTAPAVVPAEPAAPAATPAEPIAPPPSPAAQPTPAPAP